MVSKDACYHKVKSRYSVWPSAYASGALVKCRKVGAANWGNSTKKEEYIPEEGYDIARDMGRVRPSKDKKDATSYPPSEEMKKLRKINKGPSALDRVKKKYKGQIMDVKEDMGEKEHERETKKQIDNMSKAPSSSSAEAGDIARRRAKNKAALKRSEQGAARRKENRNYLRSVGKYKGPMEEVELDEKCWKGYEKKGMKTMFGKRYPNCVKKEEYSDWRDEIEYVDEAASKAITLGFKGAVAGGKAAAKKLSRKAVRAGIKVGGKKGGKAVKKAGKVAATETKKAAAETAGAVGAGAAKGLKKRKEKFVAKVKRKSEEMFSGEGKKKPQKVNENKLSGKLGKRITDPVGAGQQFGTSYGKAFGDQLGKASGKVAAIGAGAYLGSKVIGKAIDGNKKKKTKKEDYSDWRNSLTEDDMKGMSVKSGHKRPTKSGAGMTQKGVEAYRRRNPGSKLKTAVTTEPSKLKKGSKASNRRKSYCARSAGQMKKFPKAAKDPNSRLRQARRRWNC